MKGTIEHITYYHMTITLHEMNYLNIILADWLDKYNALPETAKHDHVENEMFKIAKAINELYVK